jgi:hypothetical protein
MKYYLKERINPQFKNPCYQKFGQKSAKEISLLEKQGSLYGHNNYLPFETKKEYNKKINELLGSGFIVLD